MRILLSSNYHDGSHRAVNTPWLASYLNREYRLPACATAHSNRGAGGLHCLTQCGLPASKKPSGSASTRNWSTRQGQRNTGLFFRCSKRVPFDSAIRSERELTI